MSQTVKEVSIFICDHMITSESPDYSARSSHCVRRYGSLAGLCGVPNGTSEEGVGCCSIAFYHAVKTLRAKPQVLDSGEFVVCTNSENPRYVAIKNAPQGGEVVTVAGRIITSASDSQEEA